MGYCVNFIDVLLWQTLPMEEPVSQAFKINPYNALGYGFAVVVLLLVLYIQWIEKKDYRREKEAIHERYESRIEKFVEAMGESTAAFHKVIGVIQAGDKDIAHEIRELSTLLRSLRETIERFRQ